MKTLFAFLLFFTATVAIQAQDKRETILVEKSKKKPIIKPCICGETDTLFISRKDLLDKKLLHLDLCVGKNNILKSKVIAYNAIVPGIIDTSICSGNEIYSWFKNSIPLFPKSSTVIVKVKDVKYNTDKGAAKLASVLFVVLTD